MSSPLIAVQTAIYGRLIGISPAIAGGRIYDQLPEDVAFPCVRVVLRGKPIGGIADARTWQCEAEIDVFSTYDGSLEAVQIADAVILELNLTALAVTGWTVPVMTVTDTYCEPDEFVKGQAVKRWTVPVLLPDVTVN